jgi:glutathione S-transferase
MPTRSLRGGAGVANSNEPRISPGGNNVVELKFSALSPYVRKVNIVAHEHGLAERLRLTPVNTRTEQEKISPRNPLGKIPVLVTDSGETLYDSPVICEYLDAEFGNHRLLPAGGPRRWQIMTMVALADGLLDAALLVRNERARPVAEQSPEWTDLQLGKVHRALAYFEGVVGNFDAGLDMAQVAVGAAVGYIPLRLLDLEGLPKWPKLKAWYDRQSLRASFRNTMPVL